MRKIYLSDSVDPYYNLALEEYLLRNANAEDEILYLWQNDNTVVIGRNQNPWKECDLNILESEGCRLVRRLSGGGAVYHDLGNLNFTFISRYHKNVVRDNIEIVIKALRDCGVDAVFSGKNDIQVGPYKVSGNAYFEENNMICHHGTLLLDSDINKLSSILTASKLKLESKGIDSIKARVMNLKDLNSEITVERFKGVLTEAFNNTTVSLTGKNSPISKVDTALEIKTLAKVTALTDIDVEAIMKIREKYESWHWNYGSSPEFNVALSKRYEWGEVELLFVIKDGMINQIEVNTDSLDVDLPYKIKSHLINTSFDEKIILDNIIPEIYNNGAALIVGLGQN